MEASEIVTYGDEVLRTRAEDVAGLDDETKELIERMYEIMAANRGLGLAAPQVGVSKRVFVYDEGQHAMVNPRIVNTGGEQVGIEGCLSVPGLQGEVTRYERVTVAGINEDGKKVKIKAEGLMARVFQHEMDHLDGALFVDRADPDTLEIVTAEEAEEA
jgi:peptide deformylase